MIIDSFKNLTESMFYVLMAFYEKETFGTEIVEFITRVSNGRVPMGPGTLYTILSKFEEGGLIIEIAVEGRKRTYQITQKGRDVFDEEIRRLDEVLETAHSLKKRVDDHKV
ncbi:hypothetical protein AOC36_08910 [Erysipelothrix larvae]|uniref:Transcription regulator PadR N-terminal domain-containing protein n=1 Tax=Erysipelothrix larvae TaxID=1514105 RepID=A0A0X8H116_9FIRM|nr:helix-turn-helix transcriptional regulator [Erysipelothrix larvae]AMC94103.1 hypothetical protein AOC36_08910 [Erysipelothrix larvae]